MFDAIRPTDCSGGLPLKYNLEPLVLHLQIIERAGDNGFAAIDDGDVIGDLLDFAQLMRGEEDGRPLGGR